ncbi:adenosylcobinamide-GDP ribazoletransferase [Salibacterium salarium]|uniref:Adenosylcobinamide-GDP ribazoletransferase n=1 Tax=Salibacterium salarium TaxID=284579 RepID=A0A3R9QJF7_9BACI|nr:adenosylcobinamide-GDP ribazoletransferase [Salibacterium salarium]RSL32064.1 adenosylcobinamide-GDP ribazoletransferase [Salibacterium salarium]
MRNRLKIRAEGLQMAFAFLTIFPTGTFSWNQKTARQSVLFFPACGMMIGLVAAIVASLLSLVSLPSYIIAFFALLIMIGLHGGLHLDGWMDVSDAVGSWRDKETKIKIMKDSYAGSAAVWSTMLLLSGRYLFILYVLDMQVVSIWFLFLVIPVLSRMAMAHLLIAAPLMKQEGLASWFREEQKPFDKWMILTTGVMIIGTIAYFTMTSASFAGFIGVMAFLFYWGGRTFFYNMFGGMNGDTAGAMSEGMETMLWMSSCLYISFVMV